MEIQQNLRFGSRLNIYLWTKKIEWDYLSPQLGFLERGLKSAWVTLFITLLGSLFGSENALS